MAFDAFMIVKVSDNESLQGETTDKSYAMLGASEVLQFGFTSSEAESAVRSLLESIAPEPPSRPPVYTGSRAPASKRVVIPDAKDVSQVNVAIKQLVKRIDDFEDTLLKKFEALEKDHKDNVDALWRSLDQQRQTTEAVAECATALSASAAKSQGPENPSPSDQEASSTKQPSKLKLTVRKYLDSASPGLLKAYCNASDRKPRDGYKPFKSVTLSLRKAGGANPVLYLKIIMSEVDVTSYTLDAGSGQAPPVENLTFSFESFQVDYTSQSARGTTSGRSRSSIMGWDFEKNKAT